MKKAIVLILALSLAAVAVASDLPKDPDRVDYVMDTPSRIEINGELTDASPTWDRWRPDSYSELSLDCMLNFTSDYTTEPHYDQYCLNVSTSDAVEIVVTEAGFDTVIYLYCDPFDAANPTVNGVFMDDDDGDGLLSAILPADGVTLTPGNDYWLIICSYSSTIGTYTIMTGDNVSLCGGVSAEDSSWSSVKGLFK
jgi:hypothetical protein